MRRQWASLRERLPRLEVLVAAALVALALADRLRILVAFNFKHVDEDQALLWYMAHDFAAGHVREPCFPGQPYSTAFESLLAAPLVRLGVPDAIALPLSAAALGLGAFFVWSRLAWKSGNHRTALAILCLPLVMPAEYIALSSMPRGFGPGLFAASLGYFFLESKGWRAALGGALMVIGYSLNESALLMAAPMLVYIALKRWRDSRFHLWATAGVAIGGALHYESRRFYDRNPSYLLHIPWERKFEKGLVKDGLHDAAHYFDAVSPGHSYWALIAVLATLMIVIVGGRGVAALIALLMLPALAIAALGVPKVHDGSTSVFLSLARAYLGIPLALAFLIHAAGGLYRCAGRTAFAVPAVIVATALVGFGIKTVTLKRAVDRIAGNHDWNESDFLVTSVKQECEAIGKLAESKGAPLAVWDREKLYPYACGALLYGKVETMFPPYERRTWLLIDDSRASRNSLLFAGADKDVCKPFVEHKLGCEIVDAHRNEALVKYPGKSATAALRLAGVWMRKF